MPSGTSKPQMKSRIAWQIVRDRSRRVQSSYSPSGAESIASKGSSLKAEAAARLEHNCLGLNRFGIPESAGF
jgi:hypothetical protein